MQQYSVLKGQWITHMASVYCCQNLAGECL